MIVPLLSWRNKLLSARIKCQICVGWRSPSVRLLSVPWSYQRTQAALPRSRINDQLVTPCLRDIDSPSASAQQIKDLFALARRANFISHWRYSCLFCLLWSKWCIQVVDRGLPELFTREHWYRQEVKNSCGTPSRVPMQSFGNQYGEQSPHKQAAFRCNMRIVCAYTEENGFTMIMTSEATERHNKWKRNLRNIQPDR